LYELQDININNIDDSKEVRNSFLLLKFPESLAFKCANAHLKKEWLENIENAKKQLLISSRSNSRRGSLHDSSSIIHEEDEEEEEKMSINSSFRRDKRKSYDFDNLNLSSLSDYDRNKILKELFSDFDILLAQRDFEKAIEMLLKIKQSTSTTNSLSGKQQPITTSINSTNSLNSTTLDAVQQLIYKQKETELINILRKDLITSKERANSKGVIKTGKRVVNSLIKLKIYDEAIDLFIDYHKHLNAETLKKIKVNFLRLVNLLLNIIMNIRAGFLYLQ
jgi:hypothetical protein